MNFSAMPVRYSVAQPAPALTLGPREHVDQLVDRPILGADVIALHRLFDAMSDVIAQDLLFYASQRGTHGRNLGNDVDAVATLFDHASEAAHLALDAAQAFDAGISGCLVHDLTHTVQGYSSQA